MGTAATVALTAAPGGHSGYAYTIGYYLQQNHGIALVFIIARGDSWTRSKLERLGQVYLIEITMPRRPCEPLWRTTSRWIRAFIESLRRVERSWKVLVSCGSNLSIAPALVGKAKRLKIVNVESIVRFSRPGRTPRLLRSFADTTIVHWPEQQHLHPGSVVVGPIYEPPRYKPRDEGYILVTTGTQGHPHLFDILEKLELSNVVLQTGRVDPKPYRRRHPDWIVFSFDPDLDKWIAGARIVVTHFPGMTSATAALAYRKPVVLVAAPHLKLSADVRDGRIYARKIGALYVEKLTPKNLAIALHKAEEIEPPRYENGGEKAAKIIASMAKTT